MGVGEVQRGVTASQERCEQGRGSRAVCTRREKAGKMYLREHLRRANRESCGVGDSPSAPPIVPVPLE